MGGQLFVYMVIRHNKKEIGFYKILDREKRQFLSQQMLLLVDLRHIARRPTPGNAKQIGGARRLFVRWCTSLHCLRWLRRVPLYVNYVKGQSGPNRDLLYLLHTGYQFYATLYAIWAGQVVVARIESPALAAQANQTQQRSNEAVAW